MRTKKLVGVLVSMLVVSSLTVGASQIAQKIEVYYNDIQVKVDGVKKETKLEPFNYDGSVYVGLRDVGELLGAEVDWDPMMQSVLIDTSKLGTNNQEDMTLQQQVLALQAELQEAEAKIQVYEQQIDQYETEEIDVVELEDLLEEVFEDKHDIAWYFDVKGDEKGVTVYVGFDSEAENRDFENLSQSKVKYFLEDVSEEIQQALEETYKLKTVEVEGELYDTETDDVYAEFELDDNGVYVYKWVRQTAIDEDELEEYETFMKHNYDEFPRVVITGFDTSAIRVRDITLSEKDGEVVFNIYTNIDDFGRRYWNTLNPTNATELEDYMEKIRVDLKGAFGVDVQGYVYDTMSDKMASYNGHLTLY